MKRSMAQELPSQEASSKMSKHDLEDVEETPRPTTNIFLVEPILRRLFKQIESVTKLKDLRRMCQIWDKVDTEELEERAFKGGIKSINLTFSDTASDDLKPTKATSIKMRKFLEDTSSNSHLFRSFTIVFPCSLALLNLFKFRSFYTDYSPTFLELAIPTTFKFNQDKERMLKELLRWAAPNLRELVIGNIFAPKSDLISFRKSLPVQSFNFPHLRKVRIYGKNCIVDAFKAIFIKENHPETPSLTSLVLQSIFPVDLLDLISIPSRWTTLTVLKIKCDNSDRYQCLSKLANGLLSLARAGMTLKKLDLGLSLLKNPWNWEDEEEPHFVEACRNMNEFFASQASSLEALKLSFKIFLDVSIEEEDQEPEGQIKIQLPVFERLHTLSLDLDTRVYTNDTLSRNIFEFGSISQNFPALENLNILKVGGSLDAFFGGSYEVEERMNLKWLKGMNWGNSNEEDGLHLDKYFGSVEAFACSQYTLQYLGILGDLVDTIRVLHIRNVNSELDLSQFKGLKRVVIEEDDKVKKPIWNRIQRVGKLIEHNGRYLGYFKKVAELGLDSIKFRGLEMIEGESYKEFSEAFPFRVEFEEKTMDWLDQDFIDN